MLTIITDLTDPLLDYIKDDPVRPEISREFRVSPNRRVYALVDKKPTAIVCVNFLDRIPTRVDELGESIEPNTAVFYTIWSYAPGAGVKLLRAATHSIKENFPYITRFVTLSPKTELARRFHIKNGAIVLADNPETVNYEYII
jgi:hypothetical protein